MIPKGVVVHCSDTPNGKDIGGAAEIDKWHRARGFSSIGYHIVINPGERGVEMARSLQMRGAHCSDKIYVGGSTWISGNDCVGICLIGRDAFTGSQLDSLHYYLHAMTQMYEIYPERFFVHNVANKKKTCPGFSNSVLISWYMGRWESIKPYWIRGSGFARINSGIGSDQG